MSGLEHSFVESWEAWDSAGEEGDLFFYHCKLANHLKGIEPEGTNKINMTFLMSESIVQFDFYDSCEYLSSKAFKIKAVLEEEISCEE